MKEKRLQRYIELFALAAAVIIFYKTFDSLHTILRSFGSLLGIMRSFVYGLVFAFFLYPVVQWLEGQFEKRQWTFFLKKKRFYAVLIAFIVVLVILVVSFRFLIPLVIENTIEFIGKLNDSKRVMIDYINQYITDEVWNGRLIEAVNKIDPKTILDTYDLNKAKDTALNSIGEIFDILVGIVLIPYILYEKDNLIIIFNNILSLFINEQTIKVIESYRMASSIIFYNFIYGKLIDSLIIGVIALVFYLALGYKFAIIYAVVIGITNIIPYFGPFIGGIPITMISFIADGFMPAVICGIFIICLQQFDGLFLGPHILGGQVGVRPLWIIFSITLFGGLFGVIGMFIGVPLIAIIGMILNDAVRLNRQRKNANKSISKS